MAAVGAVVPVVAEHEVVALWNHLRAPVVMRAIVLGHEVVLHRRFVHEDVAVDDAHGVALFGNHALHERLVRIDGVVEHHDIAVMRLADAIGQLVHDQPVLILERGRHAHAFDARDLEPEGDDQRGIDRGRCQRLEPRDELVAYQPEPLCRLGSGRRIDLTRHGDDDWCGD